MRTTMVALVVGATALLGLALLPVPEVQASTYANGYVDGYGYIYSDGYWVKNGLRFTRKSYLEPYHYYQGYCRYTGYREAYSYTPVLDKAKTASNVPASEDNWRARLLDIAKQRDAYELKARQSALEQNEFAQSLRLLGLEGNFRLEGYGYAPSYASNPYNKGLYSHGLQSYSQQPAVQGSTIYGYREIADVYGNVDLGALYNQVMRLRQQSYSNEAKATSETHALVGDLGEQMARIKEIEAKAAAAARVLQAANAKDRATILREYWQQKGSTQVIDGEASVPQRALDTPQLVNFTALAQQITNKKCVACHGDSKASGGLNMTDLTTLTAEQGRKILDRIVHKDPSKRMPVKADGSPGTPLSQEEVATFYRASYAGTVPPTGQAVPESKE